MAAPPPFDVRSLDKIATANTPLAIFSRASEGASNAILRERESKTAPKIATYSTWQAPCSKARHDETGFDSFETGTRVPSHSPAS